VDTHNPIVIREDKKGHIPAHLPEIMQRLELDSRHWLYLAQHFEHPFRQLVGAAHPFLATGASDSVSFNMLII